MGGSSRRRHSSAGVTRSSVCWLPGSFIHLAEEIGEIRRVTEEVLAQACSWIRGLDEMLGPNLLPRVSVNVTTADVDDPSFGDLIARMLAEHQISASRLALELTEGSVVDPEGSVAGTLRSLREAGVGVAIDDFGSGLSSLGRLRHLPFDILKVDKTLVDDVDRSPKPSGSSRRSSSSGWCSTSR